MISTQIPTSLSMKSIVTTSKTTSTSNVKVNISKFQSKKGLNISEWGSGYSIFKAIATSEAKGKVKGTQVERKTKEKKKLQELEIERMKQLNNIMRMRANDPPGLYKGDPNKVWCYKTIKHVLWWSGCFR